MATTTLLSPQEITARGKALYAAQIRPLVESNNFGKHLTINVETGDWELGEDALETGRRARAKYPDAPLFGMKIGFPAVAAVGATLRPLPSSEEIAFSEEKVS